MLQSLLFDRLTSLADVLADLPHRLVDDLLHAQSLGLAIVVEALEMRLEPVEPQHTASVRLR